MEAERTEAETAALESLLEDAFSRLSPAGTAEWITRSLMLRLEDIRGHLAGFAGHAGAVVDLLTAPDNEAAREGVVRLKPWGGLPNGAETSGGRDGKVGRAELRRELEGAAGALAADARQVASDVAAALAAMDERLQEEVGAISETVAFAIGALDHRVERSAEAAHAGADDRQGVDERFPQCVAHVGDWCAPMGGGPIAVVSAAETGLRPLADAVRSHLERAAGAPDVVEVVGSLDPSVDVAGGRTIVLGTPEEWMRAGDDRRIGGAVLCGPFGEPGSQSWTTFVRPVLDAVPAGAGVHVLVHGGGVPGWESALRRSGLVDLAVHSWGDEHVLVGVQG